MAPRPPRKIPEFTEVDYKTKAGVAWSHNYLNQKPWHPMSYPNQRRKWIAEQEHAVRESQREVAAKEFAEEQEFFKEAALLSESERKRIELAQAVSFMYQRPPGYNPEVDVKTQKEEEPIEDVKKPRVKDVFGRSIATGEEFEALKDAPKLETGIVGKAKPFALEIRNVKCARCGAFGHQSGDRDCPLRDIMMPQEEERQKREDPLQAILASVPQEAPKWMLKEGSRDPARGGFESTAANQQILPPDDMELQMEAQIGDGMQQIDESVLAQLSKSERKALLRAYKTGQEVSGKDKKRKKRRRRKEESSSSSEESSDSSEERRAERKRARRKREDDSDSSASSKERTTRKHRRKTRDREQSSDGNKRKKRKHRTKESEHRNGGQEPASVEEHRGDRAQNSPESFGRYVPVESDEEERREKRRKERSEVDERKGNDRRREVDLSEPDGINGGRERDASQSREASGRSNGYERRRHDSDKSQARHSSRQEGTDNGRTSPNGNRKQREGAHLRSSRRVERR